MNEIIQKKKIMRIDGEEIQNLWEAINRLSSAIGQKLTCSKCGNENRIILASLKKELDNLKQVNICQSCCTLEELEKTIGKDQIEKVRKEWKSKLKHLNLNPLSIAKYLHENWKISEPIIMQRLVYFTYLEILREQNIILFEENFQAWPGGPVLESVIYPMYENYKELKSFFKKVEGLDNPIVIQYLDKATERYLKLESFQIHKEARNKLWIETRRGIKSEGESRPIEENKVFTFLLYQEQNRKQINYLR